MGISRRALAKITTFLESLELSASLSSSEYKKLQHLAWDLDVQILNSQTLFVPFLSPLIQQVQWYSCCGDLPTMCRRGSIWTGGKW
jgi:hypothetical protein